METSTSNNFARGLLAAGILCLMSHQAAALVTTWTGAAGTNWSTAASWSSGTVPTTGDTVNIGGASTIVSISTATQMQINGAITVSNSATISRNSSSTININGTTTFQDSSALKASSLTIQSNTTFNWNSSGTWSIADAGESTSVAMFLSTHASSVINMSAGVWNLQTAATNQSGASTAFSQQAGTFNMTGGQIFTGGDGFTLGSGSTSARFNLGGTGQLYTGAFSVFSTNTTNSFFNFQWSSGALYIAGTNGQNSLNTRIGNGHVFIDDLQQTNLSNFQWSVTNIGGTDYTRITVASFQVNAGQTNTLSEYLTGTGGATLLGGALCLSPARPTTTPGPT